MKSSKKLDRSLSIRYKPFLYVISLSLNINPRFSPTENIYGVQNEAKDFTVVAGEHNTKVKEAFEQRVKGKEIFMHPEYSCKIFRNVRPGMHWHILCLNDIGRFKPD